VTFDVDRHNPFRPLSGKHRELYTACLRSLYERLHGPSADYTHNLTREALRDLLSPVVQTIAPSAAESADEEDEFLRIRGDDVQVAGAVIRTLLKEGWLETFGDRAGLVTAYRFTRVGKLFAQVLWELDRPALRTRQRNMRSCRNSLSAALRNVDAYDLIDAYDHAEKVISDLAEGSDYFQELVRRLMAEAARQPWDEFMDFLDRFEREFKKQLTADNVERHRQYIRDTLLQLEGIDDARYQAFERELNEVARWAYEQRTGDSTYLWLLTRIDEIIEAACNQKLPEMLRAMNDYLRRATTIVQQAFVLRGGQKKHAFARAIAHVANCKPEQQAELLNRIGDAISGAELRFLDPVSFRLKTVSERRKATTVSVAPTVTRESRLEAALNRAESGAFALSNDDVVSFLREEIQLRGRPILLSQLPLADASDVLRAMQAVEAIRANAESGLTARALPTRINTPYYSGTDYQIEVNHAH
jgi:hypothetical protein